MLSCQGRKQVVESSFRYLLYGFEGGLCPAEAKSRFTSKDANSRSFCADKITSRKSEFNLRGHLIRF